MSVNDELGYACGFFEGLRQTFERILDMPADEQVLIDVDRLRHQVVLAEERLHDLINKKRERER